MPVSVGYCCHSVYYQSDLRCVSSLQKTSDSLDVAAPEVRLMKVLTKAFTRPSSNVLSTPAAYATTTYVEKTIDRSARKISYDNEMLQGCLIRILSELKRPMITLSTEHWHAVLGAIPHQVDIFYVRHYSLANLSSQRRHALFA